MFKYFVLETFMRVICHSHHFHLFSFSTELVTGKYILIIHNIVFFNTWLISGVSAEVLQWSGWVSVWGKGISKLCSILLLAAHDELCDGKMLLGDEHQRGLFVCDEAALYSLLSHPLLLTVSLPPLFWWAQYESNVSHSWHALMT